MEAVRLTFGVHLEPECSVRPINRIQQSNLVHIDWLRDFRIASPHNSSIAALEPRDLV
jgi:hypothetical protein